MYELAGGGIIVYGGDWENLIPSGVVIDNNLIHDYEQTIHTYKPAIRLMMSVGTVVSHNEIYNAPHSAIIYGQAEEDRSGRSIDNIIEYNYIHNVMNSTYADAAVIYCGRTMADRDNEVRYNLFVQCGTGRSTWAVYFDDGMVGNKLYGNVFYDAGSYLFCGGGRDTEVYNNVAVASTVSMHGTHTIAAGGYNHTLIEDGVEKLLQSATFPSFMSTSQRVPAEGTEGRKKWEERWPELFICIEDMTVSMDRVNDYTFFVNPADQIYINNYSFGQSIPTNQDDDRIWLGHDFDEHLFYEFLNNKIENNPIYDYHGEDAMEYPKIFVNPALGDYSIKKDSEFPRYIPYAEIGRY